MRNLICILAIAIMTLASVVSCSKEEKSFDDSKAAKAAERISKSGEATDDDITLFEKSCVLISDSLCDGVENATSLEDVKSASERIKNNYPGYRDLANALMKANLTPEQKQRYNRAQQEALIKLMKVNQKKIPTFEEK